MATTVRARYVPDLKGFMGDCEANYLRFLQLLPALHQSDEWLFGAEGPDRELSRVRLQVIERSRYTTTLILSQEFNYPNWIPQPLVTVRLYHDARMAEVLSAQNSPRLRQNYDYPNRRMFHPDEKSQVNAVLGEWLLQCLASGCALELPKVALGGE